MSSDAPTKDERSPGATVGGGSGEDNGPRSPPTGDDIMLGFRSLSLSAVDPPRHILANVTGFVVKGGWAYFDHPCGRWLS